MRITSLTLSALLFISTAAHSQKKENSTKWDVSNPPTPYKETSFDVTEGTWMNLDVSPDGKQIVFDLLGDIYIMPVTGGTATALRTGIPFEVQPRFSPDGSKISFTSDANGGDNIWIMDKDGSNAHAVTKERFRLLNNAVWTRDGNYLIARKHFTSTRSLGAGELWMYHTSGGEGIQLTKRKNDQQDLGEPAISSDGKSVYFSEDVYPGGYFQYNKDPNSQIYAIKNYEFATGLTQVVTGGAGGAVRPQPSPDGKLLAFVRRVHEKSVLYIRNLASGEEWPVYDRLSKDQQEAWAIFGVYTNFAWLPDNMHIIIWSEGKIQNININDYSVATIPFKVKCNIKIAEALHCKNEAAPDSFEVKAIRQAVTSPDGKILVFNGAGKLWKKDLPDGKPTRLTNADELEFEPSFSRDGKQLVYVTWSDTAKGSIMVKAIDKGTTATRISKEKGIYRTPAFSPDGKFIIYQKEDGNDHQGYTFCSNPGIYILDRSKGTATLITTDGASPVYAEDGKRIFLFNDKGDKKTLSSVDLNGKDERIHFVSKYAKSIVPSPDNKWVAFTDLFKVYVMPFPPAGLETDLGSGTKAIPVARTTRDGGISVHWSGDSNVLHWTSGDEYFSDNLNTRFAFLPGAPDTLPLPDSTGMKIGLVLASDKPEGMIAFKGARIITMNKKDEVIENGVVVVERNKIIAVGKQSEVTIPKGCKIVDVTGKTIMPGLVDVHAHLGTFRQGLSPQQQWSYFANLAYGVTTTHDPSSNTEMVFSQSEMVKAGVMTGPRIFSTGWILYGAEGDFKAVIDSLDDARSAIKRTTDFGAFSVKSYNQPRRDQRQQVIEAARRMHVNVVPEGGSFFFHNMTMIMDGHTGIEHNIPVSHLYNDVINLWSHSGTGYTPTLIVCYGAMMGENYFYQKDSIWTNKKLLTFTPRSVIDSRSRHREMIPDLEFDAGFMEVSRSCKALSDAGVKVNLGAHGQLQGLGAHWELWMLSMGGMSNMQALKCATINGASYIGMDQEIGSLEKGKLADLIVLEKNPLENIRNSDSVVLTMVNGRLYDCSTMNQTGNYSINRLPFYFEGNKAGAPFDWHMTGDSDGD
ncbi:MAG TPA: amidohydrolase family protein [Bacteroidia bacterium]|nr:amidohydrolase family protein [Bacteroidia bacterium]